MDRSSVPVRAARGAGGLFLLLLAGFGGGVRRADAATSCYNLSCGAACSPPPPYAISTLISGFPAGAETPTAFADPGDGRRKRLVATREGAIFVWDGATGSLLPTPFLDLRDDAGGPVGDTGTDQGLLSIVADPDYAETGHLYVLYTRTNLGPGTLNDVVIARYERSAKNPDQGDPGTATTILLIEHGDSLIHSGGALAFGPDGFLYISTGDGNGPCDDQLGINGNAQRSDRIDGKILRIDVRDVDPAAGAPDDCGVGTGAYEVPSTNPYFGLEPACDEIWATGLRNPFRFSFDRLTGDLYVGDVGQNKWEEIDLLRASTPAPVNYGWVCREACESSANDESPCSTGGCPVDPGTTCQFPRASGFMDPILCHHNPGWHSIVAGYRYRGSRLPTEAGRFFYGDAVCGQIWATTTLDPANPAAIAAECWAGGVGPVYAFGEDRLGELYIVRGWAGTVDCLHAGDGCYWAGWGGMFEDGFEGGSTVRWDDSEP